MDFIISLIKVDEYNSILMVVDIFSKYATFISISNECHEKKTTVILKIIVSDRNVHFIGIF